MVTTLSFRRTFKRSNNRLRPTSSAIDRRVGYPGKLFDDITGLQNNLNRWYEPATGKWLSVDPIGFEGGDENLYRYLENRPLTSTDPSGMGIIPPGPPQKPNQPFPNIDIPPPTPWEPTKESCEKVRNDRLELKGRIASRTACFKRIQPLFNEPILGQLSKEDLDRIVQAVKEMDVANLFDKAALERANERYKICLDCNLLPPWGIKPLIKLHCIVDDIDVPVGT